MVRSLLGLLFVIGFAACAAEPAEQHTDAASTDTARVASVAAHKDVACSACHNGPKADEGRASVPRAACAAAGCHEDAGPAQVQLATARFEHRNHAVAGDVALSCAGCHTHDSGDAPLRASIDGCALCHTREQANSKEQECRLCHTEPKHEALTSQGIPVAHAALTVLETGCDRCHYDVAEAPTRVALERCATCHAKTPEVTKQGIARDLHPQHVGVTCTSCHQSGMHRIGAMSSAVRLDCADCHSKAHEQSLSAWPNTTSCQNCHRETHSAQQRLVLGFINDEAVLPSAKFMMGMTCRSCHVPPDAKASDTPRRGQASACQACHEQEFGRILDWWVNGVQSRLRSTQSYITTAQQSLAGAPDSAKVLLARSRQMLGLVDEAGGQHNLELSDLVFRTSIANARAAYQLAGQTAPPAPEMGNTPHMGTCSFCHYSGSERWNYAGIKPGLHERLVKTRQ